MALADLLRNVGAPPTWRDIYWPQFEECVLEFVQAGCERLINDQRRSAAWQEDHYTHALCEHLDEIAGARNLPFSPREQAISLSPAELLAAVPLKRARKIDLVVRFHNLPPRVCMAIEAKVVVSRSFRNYRPASTAENYVTQGVARFTTGRYAGDQLSGVMLGYLLSGTSAPIVKAINLAIAEAALPCKRRLSRPRKRKARYPYFISVHPRSSKERITLHHILVPIEPRNVST